MHNDLGDAIEAVQGELGTDPAGAYATVKARFEAIEGSTLPQVDAKGDLIVGTADNTYDNLGVGTNDTVLLAASGETKGVKWAQVPTAGIADDAVTAAKIAADAVGTSEIAAGAVGTSELADSAVTSAKIADGTIASTDVAASTFAAFGTVGNLLSENQASVETDTTGFTNHGCTIDRHSDAAMHGSYGLLMTSSATANFGVYVPTGTGVSGFAVTPGEVVTAVVSLKAPVITRAVNFYIYWFKSDGSASSTAFTLKGISALSTTETQIRLTAVVPADAAIAALRVAVQAPAGAGEVAHADKFGLWKGAGGQWAMPGVPIPGTSEIAVNNAVHLSGTGSPEGNVTAAPGSTWLQTDATTDVKGWIRWIKATGTGNTGWVAGPEADTGIRNLAAESLANSWAVSGSLFKLSRVGRTVDIDATFTKASASSDTVYTLPAGFRPQQATVARVCRTDTADDFVTVSITSAGVITIPRSSMASAVVYVNLSFVCPTTAPTSLPGS